MKLTCNVIRDILPLYVEDMVSEDTRKIMKEHINSCDNCRKQYEDMKSSIDLPMDTDTEPLKKIKSTVQRKKLQAVIFSVMVTIVISAIVIGFLTSREYIPYHDDLISFIEDNNGMVIAIFNEKVAGYDISVYPSEIDEGFVYYITTWNSIWNRSIMNRAVSNTVLNPKGEKVISVYYYNADGSEGILIYGKDQNPNGGSILLPRLFLAYYLLLAMIMALICGIILLIVNKKEKVRSTVMKIFLLPVSYILAHILIKGFSTSSYSAKRDFFTILLVLIPLYIAFLSATKILKEYKKDNRI